MPVCTVGLASKTKFRAWAKQCETKLKPNDPFYLTSLHLNHAFKLSSIVYQEQSWILSPPTSRRATTACSPTGYSSYGPPSPPTIRDHAHKHARSQSSHLATASKPTYHQPVAAKSTPVPTRTRAPRHPQLSRRTCRQTPSAKLIISTRRKSQSFQRALSVHGLSFRRSFGSTLLTISTTRTSTSWRCGPFWSLARTSLASGLFSALRDGAEDWLGRYLSLVERALGCCCSGEVM